ncbi:GNAT family N-acetyltransferase [Paenibacillus glycanilyticus]|uniref:GNAT family N-acetyltransferase n=1 Tax=Paenibacillus glycanilyticus TaxID=126569 RepID=UPI0020403CA5|nr:GNAT family N-acetyltransferase [Paenibacillus glycanilyticus]MCM3628176.1 GNAT family N-acetyltransferase [Paenibacillus glycanilyticus]
MINRKKAILENMIQTFERLSSNSPYARFFRDDNCARIETELPLTIFNRVFDYKAPHDDKIDATRQVKSIIDAYRERGVKCVWHTYSHTQDEIVTETLRANGFILGSTMSGMAADLKVKVINQSNVPGLRIVIVNTDDELEMFKRVFVAEYGLPDELAHSFTEAFAYDPEGRMKYFLAYLNDLPVGTAMTFSTGEVTGLYTVATLKEFRARGIGGALVGHALHDMQVAGATLAILQASSMGQTIYRKHGFEEEMTINLYNA